MCYILKNKVKTPLPKMTVDAELRYYTIYHTYCIYMKIKIKHSTLDQVGDARRVKMRSQKVEMETALLNRIRFVFCR